MRNRTTAIRRALAGFAFLSCIALGAVQAGELGRCYSADVTAAVVLPDGVERAPGRVRICTFAHYTPVTSLHKVYWDGALIGLFEARRDEQRATSLGVDGPVFAFARAHGTARLVLVGYATVDGDRGQTYALAPRGRVTSDWWLAHTAESRSDSSEWVLVAANTR